MSSKETCKFYEKQCVDCFRVVLCDLHWFIYLHLTFINLMGFYHWYTWLLVVTENADYYKVCC